jgi:hypothetical protein
MRKGIIGERGIYRMIEQLNKEKIPLHRWQVIVEILGSIFGVLFFIDILSGIITGVLHHIGTPMVILNVMRITIILLCFILVPAVFAFPIIIRKAKLLLIPAIIIPLIIIIFYVATYSYAVPFFLIALAFIGGFGLIAGFLIRSFRSGKKICSIIGLVIFLTPVLLIGYVITGFPFHAIPVNRTVREYIAEHYSELDYIRVGRTWYDWYDGHYKTRIHDKDDREIYFEIWNTDRGITDRYIYGYCWQQRLKKMITPLLEEEFSDDLRYISGGRELFGFYVTVGGVKIGQPFDKDAAIRTEGNFAVTITNDEPETLAAEFMKYHNFIIANDYIFTSYLFRFWRTDGRSSIHIRVPAELINDDLTELIRYMQDNIDDRGSYYDSLNLSYMDWSFVHG